jgi:peptidoglycan/LPS O-acetylase OafA/YrhL
LFPKIFTNGFLGVDIFFVISGFVVTQALYRNFQQEDKLSSGLKIFYIRRVKRILPALYFNIIITILLSGLLIPPSDLQSIFKTAGSSIVGLSNLALLYAQFDYFSTDLQLNPFVQTWSLGVEEQFYFIFPLLILLAFRFDKLKSICNVKSFIFLLILISLTYWIYLIFNSPVTAFYNPLARFWELLSGALLFLNQEKIKNFIKSKNSKSIQYFASILVLLAIFIPMDSGILYDFKNIVIVFATVFIIIAGMSNSKLNEFLKLGIFTWNGKISYSLYLWHYSIFTLFRWNYDMSVPLIWISAVILVYGISIASYHYIEEPFRYMNYIGSKVFIYAALIAMASLIFIYALYQMPVSKIYLGNENNYTNLWPSSNTPLVSSINANQRDCHLEYKDSISPDVFLKCSALKESKNNIFLMGNSHAQHLVPMLDSLNQQYGFSALTISNCRLIKAVQTIQSINYKFELCQEYFSYMFDSIKKYSKNGDIVLIGYRSLFEKPAISDNDKQSQISINGKYLSMKEVYLKSVNDLALFTSKMKELNVSVVFAGPTPTFLLPATQCADEWFRSEKKECKTKYKSILKESENFINTISDIKDINGNGSIWNILNAFCDAEYCYPTRNEKLLFRDKHHLSEYGSRMLAPSLINHIEHTGIY